MTWEKAEFMRKMNKFENEAKIAYLVYFSSTGQSQYGKSKFQTITRIV